MQKYLSFKWKFSNRKCLTILNGKWKEILYLKFKKIIALAAQSLKIKLYDTGKPTLSLFLIKES